jgi:hypothetical protein
MKAPFLWRKPVKNLPEADPDNLVPGRRDRTRLSGGIPALAVGTAEDCGRQARLRECSSSMTVSTHERKKAKKLQSGCIFGPPTSPISCGGAFAEIFFDCNRSRDKSDYLEGIF